MYKIYSTHFTMCNGQKFKFVVVLVLQVGFFMQFWSNSFCDILSDSKMDFQWCHSKHAYTSKVFSTISIYLHHMRDLHKNLCSSQFPIIDNCVRCKNMNPIPHFVVQDNLRITSTGVKLLTNTYHLLPTYMEPGCTQNYTNYPNHNLNQFYY